MRPYAYLLLATCFAAIGGCGPSNGRLAISGTVNFDGGPLDQGIISFNDVEGKKPSAEAAIQAGAFAVPAEKGLLPGNYRVAIDSADTNGPTARPDQYTMEVPMSRIPPRYNLDTKLTAVVEPSASNEFVFDLESGKSP
jgi:hypothetical protein